jgi:hypothetical protein
MRKRFRGFYLLISSLFIYLLHVPFVFAKSAGSRLFLAPGDSTTKTVINTTILANPILSVYDSLQVQLNGLSRQAFEFAKKGLNKLIEEGHLLNDSIISIVDFSQPSSNKRLYILDLKHYKVLFNTWVSHGRNSGREWAQSLSNEPSSYKSSPGFYITGEVYNGNNGYSLRLTGIEKGINDNAYSRAIVMHGANYVNPSYITAQGYIGRSEGCPAVPQHLSKPIINTIKEGSCLFIYHPSYTRHSALLN